MFEKVDQGFFVMPKEKIDELEKKEKEKEDQGIEMNLLKQENADLWYTVMTSEAKTESNETEIANLWYEVMMA